MRILYPKLKLYFISRLITILFLILLAQVYLKNFYFFKHTFILQALLNNCSLVVHSNNSGVDVPNFELKLSQIDPFVRKLKKIYKFNPKWFEIPEKLKLIH